MTFSSPLIKGNGKKKKKHIKEYNNGNINYMENIHVYVCMRVCVYTKSL